MEREIKFRGKSLSTEEWVYGYYYATPLHFLDKPDVITHCIIDTAGSIYKVDPKTVGQYIGLRDKNKQEIYSDDIAKYGMDQEYVSTVTFRDGSIPYHTPGFILDCGTKHGHGISQNIIEVCSLEIIGNIHDTPDLLTQ